MTKASRSSSWEEGVFDSLPPTSVATATPAVIECGQTTELSAANSTDPDGASDIKWVTWSSDPWGLDEYAWQASGERLEISPPQGSHRFYAKVVDSQGSTHTSYVDVDVTCE